MPLAKNKSTNPPQPQNSSGRTIFCEYAICQLKFFKNFNQTKSFKPIVDIWNLFWGQLVGNTNILRQIGVRSISGFYFYDWRTTGLIRCFKSIITPKLVLWSENGELVCIACEDNFYVLKYNECQCQQKFGAHDRKRYRGRFIDNSRI